MKLNRRQFLIYSAAFLAGCSTDFGRTLESTIIGGDKISGAVYKGIQIKFDGIRMPSNWTNLDKVEFNAVDVSERRSKLSELERELDLHPADLLNEFIDNIYPLSLIKVEGNEWAGTRTLRELYIVYPQVFHGEFSSLLYLNRREQFPSEEWGAANPEGFDYIGYDQSRPLPDGNTHFADQGLLEQGFIGPYATWTQEEDFNLYFEKLFTEPARLAIEASKHWRVNAKRDLTIEFYNGLSKEYSGKPYDAKEIIQYREKQKSPQIYVPRVPSIIVDSLECNFDR